MGMPVGCEDNLGVPPRVFRKHRTRVRKMNELRSQSPSPGRGSDVMDTDDTRESLDPESQPASEPGNQPLASANITTIDLDLQDGPSESETPTSASIAAEAHATKQVVDLKSKLREAPQHAFWEVLLEELCAVAQAQCGFVTERILASDDQGVVELPELGEPGSYLTGVGVYVAKSKNGAKEMLRGYRFPAYGTPCAHMKHDEVVVIPEGLDVTAPSNLPCLPWSKSEAFIGVPVFAEGRCVAHLGLIWTPEGAAARDLSWNFIEMIMHSLEDMIAPRIQARRSVPKPVRAPSPPVGPMPLAAIKASQSLKPYARSLSHELRTPMQGIVGMLDIMYSTVLDAIASDHHSRAQAVFKELKRHIEVVQGMILIISFVFISLSVTVTNSICLQTAQGGRLRLRITSSTHMTMICKCLILHYPLTKIATTCSSLPCSNYQVPERLSRLNPTYRPHPARGGIATLAKN